MCESYTPWTQAPYSLTTAECVEYGAGAWKAPKKEEII
jgi:hypothetical protein